MNNNMYYIKFDNYICEIEIYCDSNKNNNKSCMPICYKIINIIDIVNNTEHDNIMLDEFNHVCLIEYSRNNYHINSHIR